MTSIDLRARRLERVDRLRRRGIDVGVIAHRLAHDAEALALERVGLEERRVVGAIFPFAAGPGGIGRIDAGHRRQQQRDIRHRARHRPGGVLRHRDRE